MREDICSIPISEIFEPKDGCPICRLRDVLEERTIKYITGAAMMEPDVRIETNKQGFCRLHYGQMLNCRKKLNVALMNAPRERKAQIVGNQIVKTKRAANPDLQGDDLKKVKGQALVTARARTGASKTRVEVTDKEWNAIQAGAVSTSKLTKILSNSDMDSIKSHATPRTTPTMTAARTSRAKAMLRSGYTQAEVADALGVSVSTINNLD